MDPLEYLLGLGTLGVKFGLDSIRSLCAALDHPEHRFRSVIVGGTNGKGSVTAMVAAALRAAGYRVARYTSPHLVTINERFWIDGRPVGTRELEAAIERVRTVVERLEASGVLSAPPTFFEATTAVAFELFARAGVELAVLEVGLGGRLDATNCVEPIAAAITSIDLDHEQMLGHSLAAIAREKAGIVRPDIPVVVGRMPAEARAAISGACRDRGSLMIRADRRFTGTVTLVDGRTVLRSTRTPARSYGTVTLGLCGRHQADNAAVAVSLLESLAHVGVDVSLEAIRAGLRTTDWRGRLETVVLTDGRRLLLDAAHNPAGTAALAAFLREVHPTPLPMVVAVMADKSIDAMLAQLAGCASRVVLTRTRGRRAADPLALAARATRLAPDVPIEVQPAIDDALAAAWGHGPMICVAGSIFLVGEVLEWLEPMG